MDAWQEWKTTGCHQNGLDIFFEVEIPEKLGFGDSSFESFL